MNEDLSKLDLLGLLDRLEPVPEPAAVSLFPQTEAWLWVAAVVVGLAALLVHRARKRRKANAYRRAALQEIARVGEEPAALEEILRRTALAAFPRAEVAGLHGEAWLAFLDRTGGGSSFVEGPGRFFATAPYDPGVEVPERLAPVAARWVRRHRAAEGAR